MHHSNTTQTIKRTALVVAFFLTFSFATTASSHAQMGQDLRDVFQGLLDDVDEDIREKFQSALDNDSSEVEFSADEFRRFRANPINPFEGVDAIDPDNVEGSIILKFELPSMRDRTLNSFERQHRRILDGLGPAAVSVSPSTVTVRKNGRQVALGIVVGANGLILTKASEIQDAKIISCDIGNQNSRVADLVKVDRDNDLALLKIESENLTPIRWSTVQPLLGSFVLTPDHLGRVLSMGSYSVTPRSTVNGQQAFLGVQPEATKTGIRISQVSRDTAAWKSGLRNGDVITAFEGVTMRDVSDLVNEIRKRKRGDVVTINYQRLGNSAIAKATLAGRSLSGAQAKEFKMMNRLGAVPSKRANDFPFVFQHDTPLFPEQCGGPVVDLRGNVVGMNIARAGRAATYAIPVAHLKTIVAEMTREAVARRTHSGEDR